MINSYENILLFPYFPSLNFSYLELRNISQYLGYRNISRTPLVFFYWPKKRMGGGIFKMWFFQIIFFFATWKLGVSNCLLYKHCVSNYFTAYIRCRKIPIRLTIDRDIRWVSSCGRRVKDHSTNSINTDCRCAVLRLGVMGIGCTWNS